MTNLQHVCALPIELQDAENDFQLTLSDRVRCKTKRVIGLQQLVPTLLNRSIKYPQEVYEEYSVCLKEDTTLFEEELSYDLLVIPPGLLGIEYIKSHTYYSPESSIRNRIRFSSIVEAVNEKTTILMQKILPAFGAKKTPSIEEGIILDLQPGEKFAVPEGYYYTFINTTNKPTILARLYKNYNAVDYSSPEFAYAMGYFCIRKNARQELVYNPKFRDIPTIKLLSREETLASIIGITMETPLYELAKSKTEMLKSILK